MRMCLRGAEGVAGSLQLLRAVFLLLFHFHVPPSPLPWPALSTTLPPSPAGGPTRPWVTELNLGDPGPQAGCAGRWAVGGEGAGGEWKVEGERGGGEAVLVFRSHTLALLIKSRRAGFKMEHKPVRGIRSAPESPPDSHLPLPSRAPVCSSQHRSAYCVPGRHSVRTGAGS